MAEDRRECSNCIAGMKGLTHGNHRKYCYKVCGCMARYRNANPDNPYEPWAHDKKVFDCAMELYWGGLSRAEIALHLGIPVGIASSWIYNFGKMRKRSKPGKPMRERLRTARNADEWLATLRENAAHDGDTLEDAPISLVCGVLREQSAGKLAAVVLEALKEDPMSGKSYAFCSKGRNTVSVLAWKAPVYLVSKYIKVHGTFIWPGDDLGMTIEISKAEFDHLIFLQKSKKSTVKLLEETAQIILENTAQMLEIA